MGAAFDRWRSRCTHDNGDLKTEDKARVAAINHALRALLISSDANVTAAGIFEWVRNKLEFESTDLSLERIGEHLAYESGRDGFRDKTFHQPKKRPTICETREGVFVLAPGLGEFKFKEISHHRQ